MSSHPLSPRTIVAAAFTGRRDRTTLERRVAALEAMLAERTHALRKSEERYRAQASIVGAADDAIVAIDLEGTITTWNRGAERIYGYTAAEAIGAPLSMIVPEHLDREVAELVGEAARGARFDAVEYQAVAKGGALVDVSLTVYPIRGDAGDVVGISSIGRDIGDRMRHIAELERVNRKLAESNAELEAFSYSVSHDLRAPLRAIDGFSRLLVDEFGDDLAPEAQRYLGLVREGATRMGELIDGLLRFSRLGRQGLERVTVDAAAVARDALADLRPDGTAAVEIGALGAVDADPRLLRQVFANLLGNALKFSAGRADAVVEVGVSTAGGERAFFVRDNGVGFDMRYADRLFDVFQRLHRAEDYDGTGIGLALVRRIVERHGGRIWADAAPGRGATFFFTIPERPR